MEIWLDTADLKTIENAKQMGILHGVTTNPTIVAKSKLSLEDLLEKLLKIQDGPVTVQVTANDAKKMVEQGLALKAFSDRILVKVPVTGEGLQAISKMSQSKIPVMATAIFDLTQALLAARAGATYIAPYFSAICELDMSGIEQMSAMIRLLTRYQYPSKLIAASLKSSEQVRDCIQLGVDAVTLNSDVFSAFIENHEETMMRLERFAKDWKTGKESKKLPF